RKGVWATDLAGAAGLDAALLPTILPSCRVIGRLQASAATGTGLRAGTPVIVGAGDGACATLGSGAHKPGDAYHYLGGTSWIAVITNEYIPDPLARTSHLVGVDADQHVNYGTVQSAGTCVEWFLSEIGLGTKVPARRRLAALQPLAASSPPGANGLIFLPYLDGERAPLWDPHARGAFVGLTTHHTRSDLARAVLEGVAYALRHVLSSFEERGLAPDIIRVLGGGMRSRLWRSIFSGVYGRPLHVLERPEFCTACGAAMAAAIAAGVCRDLGDAVSRFVRIKDVEYPDADWQRVYEQRQPVFVGLYPALQSVMGPRDPVTS
ncbi:MAG: xylulokinase, partial [Armatimonadetes bacterium]|nr:xylulokinase [Armatimonadota bacterium]